ncbi:MAG: hypothetical protein IH969_03800, partial [Candidatus Krumholzibacteriota bacterium]|nr:hypothetical protein [Candidatus Krumholzibacteriota bacterium]
VAMALIAVAIAVVPPRLACAETWTLGVWNVENLSPDVKRGFPELMGSSQLNPRTSSQLRKIGDYIKNNLDADALMLSEIYVTHEDGGVARNSQLDKITDRLGDEWEYSMGTTGGKSLALLYNTERVRVKKIGEFNVDFFTVQNKDIFDRDPLVAWIAVLDDDGEDVDDLLLIALHLKSQQKFVDNHLVATAKLLSELKVFKAGLGIDAHEKDVIILGDLNDSAHRRTGFRYMFDYLEAKRFDHLGPDDNSYPGTRINGSQIDHVFIAKHLLFDWIDPSSFKVHGDDNPTSYRKTFSDHYPVTFEFVVEDE